MSPSFATLSVKHFISDVGAYVGFASIIAVAILILLYFAHARETATLRERLDEAQQRVGGLETRITQLLHAQAATARTRAAGVLAGTPVGSAPVVPAPVTPAPVALPPTALRTATAAPVQPAPVQPSPATAAGGAGAATAGLAAGAGAGAGAGARRQTPAAPAAPAGVGAPALASATKLIPDRSEAEGGAPDDTLFVPAAAVAASNGQAAVEGGATDAPVGATELGTPATQAASVAAAARTPSATPRGAVTAPPRVRIGGEQGGTGAGGGGAVRRIGGVQPSPPPTGLLGGAAEQAGHGGRLSGRVLPLLIGGIAVVVIIVGLIIITNTGGTSTGPAAQGNANATGQSLHKRHKAAASFKASKFIVAVLNGTAQAGLAGDVGTKLAGDGYRKGNITNAASQTQARTFVYYRTGKAQTANKVAAVHVARELTLGPSRVRPAGRIVIQSCGISASGAALGACTADVIVLIGQDRVSLASGGSSG